MSLEAMVWALEVPDLCPLDRVVLIHMANCTNEKWACWPRQQWLADKAACSIRTIRRVVADLAADGLIEIEHRYTKSGRRSNKYYLNPAVSRGRSRASSAAVRTTLTSAGADPVKDASEVEVEDLPGAAVVAGEGGAEPADRVETTNSVVEPAIVDNLKKPWNNAKRQNLPLGCDPVDNPEPRGGVVPEPIGGAPQGVIETTNKKLITPLSKESNDRARESSLGAGGEISAPGRDVVGQAPPVLAPSPEPSRDSSAGLSARDVEVLCECLPPEFIPADAQGRLVVWAEVSRLLSNGWSKSAVCEAISGDRLPRSVQHLAGLVAYRLRQLPDSPPLSAEQRRARMPFAQRWRACLLSYLPTSTIDSPEFTAAFDVVAARMGWHRDKPVGEEMIEVAAFEACAIARQRREAVTHGVA